MQYTNDKFKLLRWGAYSLSYRFTGQDDLHLALFLFLRLVGFPVPAMQIPRPGLAEFLADVHAAKRMAGNSLLRPKAVFIHQAGTLPPFADMQMLARILEGATASAAVPAQRFPIVLFS